MSEYPYVFERTKGGQRLRLGPDYHLGFPYWFTESSSLGWDSPFRFKTIEDAIAFMCNEPYTDFTNADVVIIE